MVKNQRLDSFLKRKLAQQDEENIPSTSEPEKPQIEENEKQQLSKVRRVACDEFEKVSNQDGHNDNAIDLILQTSIDIVLYLTFQDHAICGGDGETTEERYEDVFSSMAILNASFNDEFSQAMLKNGPYLDKCASLQFRKEILQVVSSQVKNHIRQEIGDSKFCIVVDGALDKSGKEQMALVLRFVDKNGFIQERLFDIVHV